MLQNILGKPFGIAALGARDALALRPQWYTCAPAGGCASYDKASPFFFIPCLLLSLSHFLSVPSSPEDFTFYIPNLISSNY